MKLHQFACLLASCLPLSAAVTTWPAPPGLTPSSRWEVLVDGKPLFVHQFDTYDGSGEAQHVALAGIDGPATVEVRRRDGARSGVIVRPLRHGLRADQAGASATFTVPAAMDLCLESADDRAQPLHLFLSPPEHDAPDRNDPAWEYIGPGLHTALSGKRTSGKPLYIAGGAVVLGVGVHTQKLRGRGLVVSDNANKRASQWWLGGKDIDYSGVTFVRTLPGWHCVLWGANRARLDRLRILGDMPTDDGIDVVDSSDVLIENCYIRAKDDCIAIKNYRMEPMKEGYLPGSAMRNITVRGCTLYNGAWGNGVEIGWETCGGSLEDVTVTNCDLIHNQSGRGATPMYAALSIHLCGDTAVRRVTYENLRIEARDPGQALALIQVWHSKYSFGYGRGTVEDVIYRDITDLSGTKPFLHFHGADAGHRIRGITLERVRMNGRMLTRGDDPAIHLNASVTNLRVAGDDASWDGPSYDAVQASWEDRLARFVLDGDPATEWNSDAQGRAGQSLSLDLGPTPPPLTRIELDHPWTSGPGGVELEHSSDGTVWQAGGAQVTRLSDGVHGDIRTLLAVPPTTSRRWRIRFTTDQPQGNLFQITELRAFGADGELLSLASPARRTTRHPATGAGRPRRD